jgi:stearoyl-CoA desaturase (delta-9 desaturase)
MFMLKFAAVYIGSYFWHALGITIGYHRLLSHRSFSTNKAVEYFWAAPAYLAFEGSPIWWCTSHRAHHRNVDTPLDPHSPRNGLANAWWGWLGERYYSNNINPEIQSKDLMKDPIYRFLDQEGDHWSAHRVAVTINLLFRMLVLMRFGWAPAIASLLAGLTVLQVPVLLNVVCHLPKMGYRNYDTEDDSVNVWWVAMLAMGEGWHNNHHAMPASAKSGMKPSEFDLSWQIIKGMKSLGLVDRVNVQTKSVLAKSTPEFDEEMAEHGLMWSTA